MVLNGEQQRAIENGNPVSLDVSGTECILVRKDVYLRLGAELDTTPWTEEEIDLLADEAEALVSRMESHEN